MKEIDLFSLDRSKSGQDAPAIFFAGERTNLALDAERIENQFKVGDFYLLVTTEPSQLSETVRFYLFDSELNKLDELFMGGDFYDSAFLANLKVTGEREVEFSYFSEGERWNLAVLPKKKFVLPSLNPYSGILRSGRLTSYFELKRK